MFGQAIGLRFANGMTLITSSLPDTASSAFRPGPEPLIRWDMGIVTRCPGLPLMAALHCPRSDSPKQGRT